MFWSVVMLRRVSLAQGARFSQRWNSSLAGNLSYRKNPGKVSLVDMTVGKMAALAAERWSNRECIVSVHQGVRLTYSELLNRVDKLAAGLKRLGLQPGDRVGIWGPNDAEWMIAFLAVARAGFIMAGINHAYQQSELNYCLNKVGVQAVIAPRSFRGQDNAKMLAIAKEQCPDLKHIILWGGDDAAGTRRFSDVESLASRIEVEAIGKTQDEISPNQGCNIQFTSGTTGQPKAPLLSHRSLANNGIQVAERGVLTHDHHKICVNVPFFHAFGMIKGQLASLHAGSTLVLQSPTFNPKHAIEAIIKEKCTAAYGTPTMWVNMLDVQERMDVKISSVKMATAGGAYVSPNLIKKMGDSFGVEHISIVYGLTEGTAMMFQSKVGEPPELTHETVGHLHDHMEAMVVDEKGSPVPIGTPGELWMRGYNTMLGYWNDKEKTDEMINKDGWLKTGDKFILRADGYGQIVGRIKDIIIRGGENIFPKEIETFLESHPAVLEAHVFGVHDDVYGEEICGCISLREGAKLSPNEIKSFAVGKISRFKIPRYIKVVESFPKTTSGKIQKYLLRREMESQGFVPTSKN